MNAVPVPVPVPGTAPADGLIKPAQTGTVENKDNTVMNFIMNNAKSWKQIHTLFYYDCSITIIRIESKHNHHQCSASVQSNENTTTPTKKRYRMSTSTSFT